MIESTFRRLLDELTDLDLPAGEYRRRRDELPDHDGLPAAAWRRIADERRLDAQFNPSDVDYLDDYVAEERARAAREGRGYATLDLWGENVPASVPWSRRGDPVLCGGTLLREHERTEEWWRPTGYGRDRVPVYRVLMTWRHAFSIAPDLDGTTRHVLHVLEMNMDNRGDKVRGCWPSVRWIAERIDRSRATVYRPLAQAVETKWIGRVPLHADDDPRDRMGTLYVPSVPDDLPGVGPRHEHYYNEDGESR